MNRLPSPLRIERGKLGTVIVGDVLEVVRADLQRGELRHIDEIGRRVVDRGDAARGGDVAHQISAKRDRDDDRDQVEPPGAVSTAPRNDERDDRQHSAGYRGIESVTQDAEANAEGPGLGAAPRRGDQRRRQSTDGKRERHPRQSSPPSPCCWRVGHQALSSVRSRLSGCISIRSRRSSLGSRNTGSPIVIASCPAAGWAR